MKNAPRNNQLISPDIQHDLINACGEETRLAIINDIGDRVFSILLDGARDSSVKEQLAFVLRYVNKLGEVQERFVGVVHVSDTSSQSLKSAVDYFLTKYGLSMSRVRGQGYDGVSNMRGELNGLKTLILNDNPSAWYVHCFAHQLQLVIVSAAEELSCVSQFFDYVSMIVNMVGASCKRKDALRQKQHDMVLQRIESNKIQTGHGMHQEISLTRPGTTRWGSHYRTIIRLLEMWGPVLEVLENIHKDGIDKKQRGTILGLINVMDSYEFIFIAHLMKIILGRTSSLSNLLQQKNLDIVAAVGLVQTTKNQLQQLRDDGWDDLLEEVNSFCSTHGVSIPNMEDNVPTRIRSKQGTFYHNFRVRIFCEVLDRIFSEMNNRFTEATTELLLCLSSLDPRNSFSNFDISRLLRLAELYPSYFSSFDRVELKDQLKIYIAEMRRNESFQDLDDIGALARKMIHYGLHQAFQLVFRLIELSLVLPVATATVERAFSTMKNIKMDLRNKMGDELLNDCMICYIEKDIYMAIDNESILSHF